MPSNFNRTTPVAPTGRKNVKWQTDGSGNDSAYYDLFTSVNPQIGTSYAIKDSATTGPTDRGTLVTLKNAGAVAVSIGQAGGSSLFPADWFCFLLNLGAGTVTLTPTTSTVNSAATLVLTTNQWCILFSDGANYEALVYSPSAGGGTWGSITGTLSSQTDLNTALGLKAPLASPALTGSPTTPTKTPLTNNTDIASTAYVDAAVAAGGGGVTSLSGVGIITNSSSTGAVTLTVAGTSGGIPYFSSSSGWASSAALAAHSPVLGGGAGTAPATASFLTTDGLTQLNIGPADGTNNGILGLVGKTSGTATITAPAVAGGYTAFNNGLQVPVSPNWYTPVLAPSSNVNTGISLQPNQIVFIGSGGGGNAYAYFSPTSFLVPDNSIIGFVSGLNADGTQDTTYSRGAANVHCFGNGTQGDFSGTVKAGVFNAAGSAGVSAGSFSSITAITTVGGIVTQLTGTSDERLKNAVAYEGGLDQVLAITPVRYSWNEKGQRHTGLPGGKQYVGFLAQDVQRAIPEAITGTEGLEKYLSFDDRPVMAALVNAVKQLTSRLSVLEARA